MENPQYFVSATTTTTTNQSDAASVNNLREVGDVMMLRHPSLGCVRYVRIGLGVFFVLALAISGINSVLSITFIPIGIYLISLFVPTFLLEFGYIVQVVCSRDGALCRFFGTVLLFDKWKRGAFYILTALPCFIPNFTNNYGTVCGVLDVLLGIMYILKEKEYRTVRTFISPK